MTGLSSRSWCDSVEVAEADWAAAATSFLGGGYRVVLPVVPDAVAFERDQARRTFDVLGIRWDEVPWTALEPGSVGATVEVSGGAPYDAGRRGYGAPWTRVTPLPSPAATSAVADAIDLPWAWSSESALAGLPTISSLEASLAARHLAEAGSAVGLWWNHRDELCTSTAGPLLVELSGGWVRPAPGAGAVMSWASEQAAAEHDARPATITRELLRSARSLLAVDPLGTTTTLTQA
ncbi:hypothetical protein [Nocardioides sp. W7]|uniref:hypothetical protein n=1 Tax=Nocardioides sp. W7 TaxID=2931390 RepID=UPI001FD2326D|nr:hypothetical protein [Nocardioides sp. W7]